MRHRPYTLMSQSSNSDNHPDDAIFYDDFADQGFIGGVDNGGKSIESSSSLLKDRLESLQQAETKQAATVLRNWKLGNWNVRGFSMDPWKCDDDLGEDYESAESTTTTPIHISIVATDAPNDPTRLWVGRSDGSLLLVQLGTEYWTTFKSQLSLTSEPSTASSGDDETDENTILRVSNQLTRADEMKRDDITMSPTMEEPTQPFEIIWQHDPSSTVGSSSSYSSTGAVSHIKSTDSHLFTSNCDSSGTIQQWILQDNADDNAIVIVPSIRLQGAHTSDLVCLESVSNEKLLLSVAKDGSMAFWDSSTGDLVYKCTCNVDGMSSSESSAAFSITSAATDGKHVFLGTESGVILVYLVKDLIQAGADGVNDSCPLPNGQWLDNKEELSVTAIACAGEGSLGRGSKQSSLSLLTGCSDGTIKQWEVLSRSLEDGQVKLEQWPKLATQRLPKTAHVFSGHHGAVTALKGIDATKFLSAAHDGTICAWNPATGKELFSMNGFTEDIRNLCLEDDLLITNGMKQFVCIHDFSVSEEGNDFELDMPEYEL